MDKLTDLDICKRIAEIEGFDFMLAGNTIQAKAFTVSDTFSCCHMGFTFNPLTDDALCFRLMVKHKVELKYYTDGTIDAWITFKNHETYSDAKKAICSEIIKAN